MQGRTTARFYWFRGTLVIALTVAGCNLTGQGPQSFVKADVEAQAQRGGVELRNLTLSSSEMGVTSAEAANGVERRAWVRVSFIYHCPKEQIWRDGYCGNGYRANCLFTFSPPDVIPVVKIKGVWQYECTRPVCDFANPFSGCR